MTIEALLSTTKDSLGVVIILGGFLWAFFKVSNNATRALDMAKENREFTASAIKDLSEAMKEVGQRLGSMENGIYEIRGQLKTRRRNREDELDL